MNLPNFVSPELKVESFLELLGLCCHYLYCILFRHRRPLATISK